MICKTKNECVFAAKQQLLTELFIRMPVSTMHRINNYRIIFYFINNQVRKTFQLYVTDNMLFIYKTIILGMFAYIIEPLK
jgi:hypothetical protein